MSSYQDTLLINTYTNDIAIVPDIFSSSRKRGNPLDEDLLELELLYDQSPFGQRKRQCPLPPYMSVAQDYYSPAFFETEPIQKVNRPTVGNMASSVSVGNPVASESKQANVEKVQLTITEQPEQFYRARYDSEGVRAPLKGIHENYPTVELRGESIKQAVITVKLVHENRSTHTCCSLDSSDDRKRALTKKVTPIKNVIKAEFEDLRIRREKKKETRKGCDRSVARDGKHDKVAYLLFTADVDTNSGPVQCSAISSPISLTAAPEPAELDWLVPARGHFGGKEVLAIKGSKMTSPKVIFRIIGMNGERIELPGTVDKEKSHQNVLLVRTPVIDHLSHGLGHHMIKASIVVITGRNQMCSNSLDFEFIPNEICRECMQETPIKVLPPNPCPPPTTNFLPPHSPMPSTSPGPVYSPPFISPSIPSPPSKSPFHDLPSVHTTLSVPSVSTDVVIPPTAPTSFPPTSSPMDTKDKQQIMQIMEDLMSPSNAPPTYSDIIPLYSTSPCNPTSPQQDTFQVPWEQIEESLRNLQEKCFITESEYMLYLNECRCYNVELWKAYSMANGNLHTFRQNLMLASFKPPLCSTHQ